MEDASDDPGPWGDVDEFHASLNRAVERLSFDGERVPEFERGDVLYDLSRLLLALEPTAEDLRTQRRLLPQDRQLQE